MFQIQWLRRWIRRSMKPMPHDFAHSSKKKLSLAYAFFAWNALAVVGYAMYNGKRDWAAYYGLEQEPGSPAEQFSRMLDIPRARVMRISGFTTVEEFEIDNTELLDTKKNTEESS